MKKLLAILLSVLMAFSVMPYTVYAEETGGAVRAGELETQDFFEMGMYPQSEVTDETTVTALNAIDCTMLSYGYYRKTDESDNSYEMLNMDYADVEYSGELYRKMVIHEYRPQYTSWPFEYYQRNNGYETEKAYYFKWEPIQWQVLKKDDGGVYALSIKALDSQPYHNFYVYDIVWKDCSLREWLNGSFYNWAFSADEKAGIVPVTLSEDVTDNVWALSTDEIADESFGLHTDSQTSEGIRKVRSTDYANSQGMLLEAPDLQDFVSWWTRSKNAGARMSYVINYGGTSDQRYIDSTFIGVLPTVKLSLDAEVNPVDIAPCDYEGHKWEWTHNETKHWHKCSVCGVSRNDEKEHDLKDAISVDGTYHKYTCGCGWEITEGHIFNGGLYCTVCGERNSDFTSVSASELTTGNFLDMGMYPQTEVKDEDTIAALNEVECTPVSYGYIKNYDSSKETQDLVDMSYADIIYNDKLYRKVILNGYRPDKITGDENTSEQDDNGYNPVNVYYFKWDPIKWRVLAKEDDGVYVLSESILDAQPMHLYGKGSITWQETTLRTWLNDDFYNTAFSENEKSKIAAVPYSNPGDPYPGYDTGSDDATDKIYLASYYDLINSEYGFKTGNDEQDDLRVKPGSDYACCQGLYYHRNTSTFAWWLRTNGRNYSDDRFMLANAGQAYWYGTNIVNFGVAPVFKIKLDATVTCSDSAACWKFGHNWKTDYDYDGNNHWHACSQCSEKKDVTEHSWNTEWSKSGEKHWHECAVCGAKKDEAEHSYGGWTPVDDNTHKHTCVCGAEETATHTYGEISYTWTKVGNDWKATASRTCATCNKVQSETVTATGVPSQAPTCTAMGKTTYTATFSNSVFETQIKTETDIPENGHGWATQWSKDATYHWYDCANCDEVKDKAEHNYAAPTYTWDGTSSVTAERKCNDCGWTETETKATTSEQTKDPTCTAMGKTTYTATFDNPAFTTQTKTVDDISALNHDWKTEWSKDAEYHWHDCTRCSEVNDKAAHNYATPTYTWNGTASVTAERVCDDCGWTETETKATTSEQTKDPTCTEMGETTYTATFDNPAFETQSTTLVDVPANGHSYEKTVTEPTCTEQGYTTYTCIYGDDEYVDDYTDALGHLYGKTGDARWTCQRCGKVDKSRLPVGWDKDGGKWYYYKNGVKQQGWLTDGDYKYYLDPTTKAMVTGWKKLDGNWYYFNIPSGAMAKYNRVIDGKQYYFNSQGVMKTGWVRYIESNEYRYFGADGAMITGWRYINGNWYYLHPSDGYMHRGWLKDGGKWYYFIDYGPMVTGTKTINGKTYTFDKSGVCQNP